MQNSSPEKASLCYLRESQTQTTSGKIKRFVQERKSHVARLAIKPLPST